MTEIELMDVLQSEGWTMSKIESEGKQVYRAGRFREGRGHTRYIATANTLIRRSKQDVLSALSRKGSTRPKRKGAGRPASPSVKEAMISTVKQRSLWQGMQGVDDSLSFEERARIYAAYHGKLIRLIRSQDQVCSRAVGYDELAV
jgi:hypothetical protein